MKENKESDNIHETESWAKMSRIRNFNCWKNEEKKLPSKTSVQRGDGVSLDFEVNRLRDPKLTGFLAFLSIVKGETSTAAATERWTQFYSASVATWSHGTSACKAESLLLLLPASQKCSALSWTETCCALSCSSKSVSDSGACIFWQKWARVSSQKLRKDKQTKHCCHICEKFRSEWPKWAIFYGF